VYIPIMGKRMHFRILTLLLFVPVVLCAQKPTLLDSLLYADTSAIMRKVLGNPDKYRLQIIYSQTDYSNTIPNIKTFSFREQNEEYFYPASLVKLPVAALTLEKIRSMNIEGLNKNSLLYSNPRYSGIPKDSLYPTIADNILQMLVVSENNAFNRMYDFLGQEYMHLRLFQKGYTKSRITQRMSSATVEENRKTGPIKLVSNLGKIVYEEEAITTVKKFSNPAKNVLLGKGYMLGGRAIKEPKDFTLNNFMPLNDVHQMLISIIQPEFTDSISRLEIEEEDYTFLRKALSIYPHETTIDKWKKDTTFYPCMRKYVYYGNYKGIPDSSIRIFNKVGMAYGFMSDVGYLVDYKNKIEFYVSVVMYVNEDEIINDNRYDYYTIGYPFMERLGKLLYQYETTRNSTCRNKKLSLLDYR